MYDTGDIVSADGDGYLHIRGPDETLRQGERRNGQPHAARRAGRGFVSGAKKIWFAGRGRIARSSRGPMKAKAKWLIAVSNEPKLTLDENRAAIRAKGIDERSACRARSKR